MLCGAMFYPALASAATVYAVAPDAGYVQAIESNAEKSWGYGDPDDEIVSGHMVFNLYYMDIRDNSHVGFADDAPHAAEARARLAEVLTSMGDALNEWGTLDLLVHRSETDGGGFSAYAGTYYTGKAGFQQGAALYRLRHWAKQSADLPDMFLSVDFGNNYSFSTDAPGPLQEDFSSLLLRVMTHALGLVSLIDETGASRVAPGVYTVWDSHIVRGEDGLALVSGRSPQFQGRASDLTCNDLWFDGSHAFDLYGQGVMPRIQAPGQFRAGESLSHWAPGEIEGGAVMDAVTPLGTARRQWAPVDIGALADIGYVRISTNAGGSEVAFGCHSDGATDAWTSLQNGLHEFLLALGFLMVMAGHRFLTAGRRLEVRS